MEDQQSHWTILWTVSFYKLLIILLVRIFIFSFLQWDECTTRVESELTDVRGQLQCSIISLFFHQALTTLRNSTPDLFSHIVISSPEQFLQHVHLDLLPAIREISSIPIIIMPGSSIPGTSHSGLNLRPQHEMSQFCSHSDVLYVRHTGELITQLALVIPRIISENDVIWPKMGDVISSNQSRMHYTIGERLAEGSYAVVHLCEDYFQQPFVMKIQKPHRCKTLVETDWNKERDFLQTVNHPNTIRLYDAFVYNNLYYYVMERADGTLRSLLDEHSKNRTGLPFETFINFAGQLLSGLCHIHKKKIIHRDLQVCFHIYFRRRL